VGGLNAGLGLIGIEPQSWFTEWPRNTFMLILVGIWMWVGFATVILSAGLKGISTELLEAARMDGATELQVFFRIILPLLAPTVAVVGTTIVITAPRRSTSSRHDGRPARHGGHLHRLVSRPVHEP
jgi:alpha-glucoside transport system permease protein